MRRIRSSILALLLTGPLCLLCGPAISQSVSYSNITTQTTTTVKPGAGILRAVCINTATATATITIYDSTTAAGTKIATITEYGSTPRCFSYNVNFFNGLTVVTATATSDITVAYQ